MGLALDAAFVWRTGKEDGFWKRALPGYREYAAVTRYRLIPGVR